MVSEVQFSFDALSFLKEALPEQEATKPTESLVTRKAPTVEPVKAQDENQTMLRDFATRLNDRYDLAKISEPPKQPVVRSAMIQEYLDSVEQYSRDEKMRSSVDSALAEAMQGGVGESPSKFSASVDPEAIESALMEATRPPIGQLTDTARTAMFSSADMRGADLTMKGNAREAQEVFQPMVTPVSRGEQPEMTDSPAPVDAPSIDTRSNEMLDKPKGMMNRPALTDDDMGLTDIPTFGVGSRKFNSSVVDEMVSLEGMGGDDLSATPTYSYGITKEKADEYNLVPSNFKTMREFADAFADKYIEEKYEANKSIFDNVDSKFHKPLMSYLWNAGSFGTNQRKALSKKNPDVRGFIKEMRDAIHSEGFASSGLSARRAKEANLLGEGLANWEDIVKVEVSGTKEKPVFKWVTASGDVVEEFASGKNLHPNNKLSDVTL